MVSAYNPLENSFAFVLPAVAAGPHSTISSASKTEPSQTGQTSYEPQIFRNLGYGAYAVKLRRETALAATVSRNSEFDRIRRECTRGIVDIVATLVRQVLELAAAMVASAPMIGVFFRLNLIGHMPSGWTLVEKEAASHRGSTHNCVSRKFLAVCCHQLASGLSVICPSDQPD